LSMMQISLISSFQCSKVDQEMEKLVLVKNDIKTKMDEANGEPRRQLELQWTMRSLTQKEVDISKKLQLFALKVSAKEGILMKMKALLQRAETKGCPGENARVELLLDNDPR